MKAASKTGKTIFFFVFFTFSLPQTNSASLKKLCENNGQIVEDDNNVSCACPHPFTGKHCEDFACVNGLSTGDQYDPNSLYFNKRCLCDPGWLGELCDKSLINRCGENGAEQKGKCVCRKNFAGDRCQHVTKCVHGQLFHSRCACHYGWSGDFCDIIICHNGVPDADFKSCNCPSQYRGKYCDFCAKSASSPPPECADIGKSTINFEKDNMPIFLAVIITLAIILMGALIYLLCQTLSKHYENKLVQRRQRNDAEANQSATVNGDETRVLNAETSSEKMDMPPKYEDIVSIPKHSKGLESTSKHVSYEKEKPEDD